MGKATKVSLVHRQALNEIMIYTSRAPQRAKFAPAIFMRALRVTLCMTQAGLARRAGMTQAQIVRLESGRDARLDTWRKVYDAMFCDLLIIPKPRKQRPGEELAQRRVDKPDGNPWSN